MEIGDALLKLKLFWAKQDIKINGCPIQSIDLFQRKNNIKLPLDFVDYFATMDGMNSLFPNGTDEEGFLFYPLNEVVILKSGSEQFNSIIIFADYLQCSWNYYLNVIANNKYEIGINPSNGTYKPITNSLATFIQYYLEDDSIIYTY